MAIGEPHNCMCQGTVCQCRQPGIWSEPFRYTSNVNLSFHARCECHDCTQFRKREKEGLGLGNT